MSSDIKLAIAPIAWTNDDIPSLGAENTFEQCISEMALSGYQGSEVGNKYPKDPDVLKHYLSVRGLTICNQWFSSFLLSQSYEEVEKAFVAQLDFLEKVGAKVIGPSEQSDSIQGKNLPVFDRKPVYTDEEWKTVTQGLNKLGKVASDRGFRLAYHHHMGTGIQTMAEVDRFLDMTDPRYVNLIYDSGHFAFAGEDPLEAVKRYISRIVHVHLKDVRYEIVRQVKKERLSFLDAVKLGAFTVPGDGDIDFIPIFDVLKENNYKGWVVVEAEQDPAKANPYEYALKARGYIREHLGV